MIFTSITFLVFYLVLLAMIAMTSGDRARQYLLLVASYIFYAAWNPVFVLLIGVISVVGWYLGLLIGNSADAKRRRALLTLCLVATLGPLAYFKYANFLMDGFGSLFGVETAHLDIILPVGISFFTFQVMSYVIDLYRGRIGVCRSLPKFMLFVAFFPQLVAGPIVRASEFLPQLDRYVRLRWDNIWVGGQIFLGGAIQKVLIADQLSQFVDPVFAAPSLYSASTLWLAMVSYAMQIFCDFSGYSLMAIGVARTFGFELPKNFDMPYLAGSITEFWRRWHISLSTWLRDYLYISLGGNRKGEARTYVNLMVTMLLGGLWHGASWNFVLWGGMHGVGLAIHKIWSQQVMAAYPRIQESLPYKLFSWVATILFVSLLWVPFRSGDFATTIEYYQRLLPSGGGILWAHTGAIVTLTCVAAWHVLHLRKSRLLTGFPAASLDESWSFIAIGASLLLIMLLAPLNTSPFIYFQF